MSVWLAQLTRPERHTFVATFAGWALDGMDVMAYTFIVPTLISAWSISVAQAGALASSALLVSAAGGWLAGLLADRYGRARILQLTILWFAVFTFLSGFTQSFSQLLVTRALQGLGFGGEWAVGSVLIGETMRAEHRGKAVGTVQAGWAVGWGLAALSYTVLFALLPAALAWRAMFWIGILPALLVFYIRRNVPEPELCRAGLQPRRKDGPISRASAPEVRPSDSFADTNGSAPSLPAVRLAPHQCASSPAATERTPLSPSAVEGRGFNPAANDAAPSGASAPEGSGLAGAERQSAPNFLAIFHVSLLRTTLLTSLLAVGAQGGYYAINTWLPTFLKSQRGLSVLNTGAYLAVIIAGSFAGYLASAHLADSIGRRPTLMLFAVSSFLAVLAYTYAPFGNRAVLALGFPLGFFASGIFSPIGAFFTELFPGPVRGSGQGFSYNSGRAVGALFPVLVGRLAATMSLGHAIAAFAVSAYALLILAVALLPETKGRALRPAL